MRSGVGFVFKRVILLKVTLWISNSALLAGSGWQNAGTHCRTLHAPSVCLTFDHLLYDPPYGKFEVTLKIRKTRQCFNLREFYPKWMNTDSASN